LIIITINSIEKIKELEKKYSEAEKLAFLGAMTKGLVHEIRNPLVSLIGFAQKMCKDTENNNPQRGYMDIVSKEAQRLEDLLHYLEDFTHLPQPSYRLEYFGATIEKIKETLNEDAKEKNISINIINNFQEKEADTYLDSGLITKALSAILINAIEAISHDGQIDITITPTSNHLEVKIADSGCGIPKNYLNVIFDPFFTTKTEHIGLSLATVKRIIEDLGGTIKVESNLGEGTTFLIKLVKTRRSRLRFERV
jgi:signal transduction histidine kinase